MGIGGRGFENRDEAHIRRKTPGGIREGGAIPTSDQPRFVRPRSTIARREVGESATGKATVIDGQAG